MKRKMAKVVAFIMSMTLFVTNVNFSVLAKVDVDQELAAEEQEIAVDNQEIPVDNQEIPVDNQEIPADNQIVPADAQETTVSEDVLDSIISEENVGASSHGLSTPRVSAEGVSTWDCVYFGQYIQEDINGDGEFTEEDKSPIKWRVMDIQGNEACLISDEVLDIKRYSEAFESEYANYLNFEIWWSYSTIRSWLNGYDASENGFAKIDYTNDNFIKSFNNEEYEAIVPHDTFMTIADKLLYTGPITQDKIRLAHVLEITDENLGFTGDDMESPAREAKMTPYVKTLERVGIKLPGKEDNTAYALISQGIYKNRVGCVYPDGQLNYDQPYWYKFGIRPVLYLDLTKDVWKKAGTVSSDGQVTEADYCNIIFDANGGTTAETVRRVKVGEAYGKLPEAEKAEGYYFDGWFTKAEGGNRISEADVAAEAGSIRVYAHYQNIHDIIDVPRADSNDVVTWDCIYFGNYLQEDTNGDSVVNSSDDKLPIKWRVLDIKGNKALILADKIIDAQWYSRTRGYGYEDLTWNNSTLRGWLNGYNGSQNIVNEDFSNNSFLNDAFSIDEASAIECTKNSNKGGSNIKVSDDTDDWIFLLSAAEVKNKEYGLGYKDSGVYKTASASAYAKGELYAGEQRWWIRDMILQVGVENPGIVNADGTVDDGLGMVSTLKFGVRPALYIDLNSNVWRKAGTVSSDGSNTVVDAIKVSFDAKGGNVSQSYKYIVTGDKYMMLPYPEKEGYSFDGWYEDEAYTNRVTADTIVTQDVAHTLYANWTANEYWVKFDTGVEGRTIEDRKVVYGQKYGSLPTFSRKNYIFDGWTSDKEGTQKVDSNTIVNTADTHTLYAKWRARVTVTFDAGYEEAYMSSFSKDVYEGGKYGELPVPQLREMYFLGWYTEKNGGGNQVTENTVVTSKENHTLYANWEIAEMVDLRAMGGHCDVANLYLCDGKAVGTLPEPSRVGYMFTGWYTKKTGGVKITEDTVYIQFTHGNTFYAQWEKQPLSNITYKAVNGRTVYYADTVWFGNYPQEDINNDGVINDSDMAPIRWKVMKVENGKALLMTDKLIDARPYGLANINTTYVESTLRSWLNGYNGIRNDSGIDYSTGKNSFINKAFTTTEKNAILTTVIEAFEYDDLDIGDGWVKKCNDKIFIATYENDNFYKVSMPVPTSYTKAIMNDKEPNSQDWNLVWTRQTYEKQAELYDMASRKYTEKLLAESKYRPVCPMLYIDLTSNAWTYAGKIDNKGNVCDIKTITLDANTGFFDDNTAITTCDVYTNMQYDTLPVPRHNDKKFAGWYTAANGGKKISGVTKVPETGNDTLYAHWADYNYSPGYQDPVIDANENVTWQCVYIGRRAQKDTNGDVEINEYDEKTPLKWRILSVDGDDALVMSDKLLEVMNINETEKAATWPSSSMRSYLNGYNKSYNAFGKDYSDNNFIDNTFTAEEKAAIVEHTYDWTENPEYYGRYVPETKDKISLMSVEDASDYNYGFARPSVRRGDFVTSGLPVYCYWLRTPGEIDNKSIVVLTNGIFSYEGVNNGGEISFSPKCTRPIMHIDLTKDVIRDAGTVCSDGSVYEKKYPVKITLDAGAGSVTTSQIVVNLDGEYGNLPTPKREGYKFAGWYTKPSGGIRVTSTSIVSSSVDHTLYAHYRKPRTDLSDPRVGANDVVTWDCVWFGDYYSTDTNGDGIADDKDLKLPIKWRVLSVDGDDAFLVTEQFVDYKPFFDGNENNWKDSYIRKWLNGFDLADTTSFYNNAFNDKERAAVKLTTNDNIAFDGYSDPDTEEKVFLLSAYDAKEIDEETGVRLWDKLVIHSTDYVYNMTGRKHAFYYWLRTLKKPNDGTVSIDPTYNYFFDASNISREVRPAIHLDLSKDVWTYAGTVSNDGSKNEIAITYKLNLDSNNGSGDVYDKTVTLGKPYGILYTPEYEGYVFDGWYTEKEGGQKVTKNTLMTSRSDLTVYAHWKEDTGENPGGEVIPNLHFFVNFDAGEGTVETSHMEVVNGQKYGELPVPVRKQYVFAGWYTKKTGGRKITSDTVVALTQDQKLYARWEYLTLTVKQKFDISSYFAGVADIKKYAVEVIPVGDVKAKAKVSKKGVFSATKPGRVKIMPMIKVGKSLVAANSQAEYASVEPLVIDIVKPVLPKVIKESQLNTVIDMMAKAEGLPSNNRFQT